MHMEGHKECMLKEDIYLMGPAYGIKIKYVPSILHATMMMTLYYFFQRTYEYSLVYLVSAEQT